MCHHYCSGGGGLGSGDTSEEAHLLYFIFKMLIGTICLILAAEYAWTYMVYQAASFGILYIGDMLTWLMAGLILLSEGLLLYLKTLSEITRERIPLAEGRIVTVSLKDERD